MFQTKECLIGKLQTSAERRLDKRMTDKTKEKLEKSEKTGQEKPVKKTLKKLTAVDELTSEEREAVTIVFHQYETGLREGTIFTKVRPLKGLNVKIWCLNKNEAFKLSSNIGSLITEV